VYDFARRASQMPGDGPGGQPQPGQTIPPPEMRYPDGNAGLLYLLIYLF